MMTALKPILVALFVAFLTPIVADAATILVYHWNDNTRVILTTNDCPHMAGSKVAVAQTRDMNILQYGCYTYNAEKGVVHIQWSEDVMNFDELNVEGFAPEDMKEEPSI